MTKQPRGARYALLVLVFSLLAFPALAQTRDPARFFDLNMGDLKAEASDARAEGKKAVLLVFEQEGCPYCRFMREKVLNRAEVQDYYHRHFSTFTIDIWSSVPVRDFGGRDQTEKSLAQASKVRATPTFVFYDVTGNEAVRIVGTVETPEEFLLLGQFVSTGAYKTRSFAQYKANPKGT